MNIFKLIIGALFISIGLFFVIIYLNLFYIGYTFLEFVYFIIRRGIILFFLVGIFLIYKEMERKR